MTIRTSGPEVEEQMQVFYESLSERDRRWYAGVDASKLGHGGIEYIARVLDCDPKTVRRGQAELLDPPDERIGKKGRSQVLS